MKVRDIMHSVDRVSSDTFVSEAAKLMDQKLVGSVLIEEKGNVVGIMTERDILRKVVAKGLNANKVRTEDIMSSPVLTIDVEKDILEASNVMDKERIRRLIVTERGKIIGKVTSNSISRNLKFYLAKKAIAGTEYIRPQY